jgi:hypothetical protein
MFVVNLHLCIIAVWSLKKRLKRFVVFDAIRICIRYDRRSKDGDLVESSILHGAGRVVHTIVECSVVVSDHRRNAIHPMTLAVVPDAHAIVKPVVDTAERS